MAKAMNVHIARAFSLGGADMTLGRDGALLPELSPEPAPRGRPHSRAAVERVLRITALIWSAAWIASIAATFFEDPSLTTQPALAATCIGAIVVAWVVLALVPHSGAFFVGVAVTAALLQIATHAPLMTHDYFNLDGSWLVVVTVSAALLLPHRWAVPIIVGVTCIAVLAVAAIYWRAGLLTMEWRAIADLGIRALADGMAVSVGSRALRAAADDVDVQATRLSDEMRGRQIRETYRREVRRTNRILHDTFINTLGVIRGGVPPSALGALRERCALDLDVVRAARGTESRPWVTASDVEGSIRALAGVLGLEVEVTLTGDPSTSLSGGVGAAVIGIAREGLTNVAKHSGVSSARVEVALSDSVLDLTVADDGRGFDGEAARGGGIDESVVTRAALSGGSAAVESSLGHGTIMKARLPLSGTRGGRGQPSSPDALPTSSISAGLDDRVPLRRVYRNAGLWFLVLVTSGVVIAPSGRNSTSILVYLIVVASMAIVLKGPWRVPPLPGPLEILLVISLAPVIILPAVGASPCTLDGMDGWGLDAALVLFLAVALLGRTIKGAVWGLGVMAGAVIAVPVANGESWEACGIVSFATLAALMGAAVGMTLFRHLLDVYLAEADRERSEADTLVLAETIASASQRARESRLDTVLSSVGPLMLTVVEGSSDPLDPEVQARAGRHETALRSLLTIDPGLGLLGERLADLLLVASSEGKSLDIRSGEAVSLPSEALIDALAALARRCIELTPVGESLLLTVFAREEAVAVLLVIPARAAVASQAVERAVMDGLLVTQEQLDDQTLVEATWSVK